MSVIDELKARIAALEAGGDLAQRVAAIESVLGLTPAAPTAAASTRHCDRCGSDQKMDDTFRCSQTKCPLKP